MNISIIIKATSVLLSFCPQHKCSKTKSALTNPNPMRRKTSVFSFMSRVLALSLFVPLKFLVNNRGPPVAPVYKRMQFECEAVRKSRTNYLIYQQKQRELSLVFNH